VENSEKRGRGKVRDTALRDTILEAAASLLLEVGYRKFTMEGVAARSGASKVTLYKWSPTKGVLALAAFTQRITTKLEFPETASPLDDVKTQLRNLITMLTTTDEGRALRELIGAAQEDPLLKTQLTEVYVEPRRVLAAKNFARWLKLDPESDRATLYAVQDQIYGAVYNRLLFGLEPLTPAFADELVAFWDGRPLPSLT
jgi:AcrR family transcriptional regulator